ncbi:hypothetical protein, partial [Zhongshania sp.]|uniref:hypothetical protein n=1 Tax=Zhongshania sp. TaxID=1971902 RepID=UPI00356660F6
IPKKNDDNNRADWYSRTIGEYMTKRITSIADLRKLSRERMGIDEIHDPNKEPNPNVETDLDTLHRKSAENRMDDDAFNRPEPDSMMPFGDTLEDVNKVKSIDDVRRAAERRFESIKPVGRPLKPNESVEGYAPDGTPIIRRVTGRSPTDGAPIIEYENRHLLWTEEEREDIQAEMDRVNEIVESEKDPDNPKWRDITNLIDPQILDMMRREPHPREDFE